MPEVDVVPEIRRDVEIEQTIAIVIEPDSAIAVHPAAEAGLCGDVLEVLAVDVSEQRQIAVAINEHVFAAVVIEVTPHGAHRHALSRPIEIREPRAFRDLLEGAIPAISVQRVGLTEATVGEIQIGLSVGIEVRDGHRCPQPRNVWLYAGDLWIERRPVVHEMNSGGGRLVTQHESRVRRISDLPDGAAIQSHREKDRRQEGHGDDGAPNGGARSVRHR